MERGDSLAGALDYVNRALDKRGPVAFDRAKPSARSDAIASTIAASLELLSVEDQRRCAELAVFPEDTLIPLSALRALWGLDPFDVEELVQALDGAALIDFDLKNGAVRVHDVLKAYLRTRLDDARAVHARLVEKGWPDPYRLPDAYAWRWFGWHAVQAGQAAGLAALLRDFRWLESKLRATNVQSLLQDFELLRDDTDLRVVHEAIRLASHGLAQDPAQLAAQLHGRLERGVSAAADALLGQVDAGAARPSLALDRPSLTHPGGALVRIMKGHSGSVQTLALSGDGRWLVSGSGDWTLRVWAVADGRSVRVLSGHAGVVHCVAAVPGGTRVVSGSEDRMLRIWDVETGEALDSQRGHHGAVTGLAITPDGRRIASTSDDRGIRIWTLGDAIPKARFAAYSHQVRALAWTGDGLVVAPGDETIVVLDPADGSVRLTLRGHEGLVKALAVSRDGRRLLSGAVDRSVRLWDLETGRPLQVLSGHRGEVTSVAFGADDRIALSGAQDHTLRLWHLDTGTPGPVFEGHADFVTSIATSADGAEAWSGSGDKSIRHWSLAASPAAQPALACEEPVTMLALSADGTWALTGSRNVPPSVWNVADQRVVGVLDAHGDIVTGVWLSADGRRAVTSSRDRTLRVWDVASNRCAHTLRGHAESVRRLAVDADGRHAVSLSRDRTLRVWDLHAGRAVRALVDRENERGLASLQSAGPLIDELETGPRVDLTDHPLSRDARLAISSDGGHVLIAEQGNLGAWDLRSGETCYEVWDVFFDIVTIDPRGPEGAAVLGARSGSVRIWDPRVARTIHAFDAHKGPVFDVVTDLARGRLITAGRDGAIRLWALDTLQPLGALDVPQPSVDEVVIAPNGTVAFAVSGDTIVASDLVKLRPAGSLSFDFRIVSIAVTGDGTRLAVGDESGLVHFLSFFNEHAA
jgi:WD40 repeat protein